MRLKAVSRRFYRFWSIDTRSTISKLKRRAEHYNSCCKHQPECTAWAWRWFWTAWKKLILLRIFWSHSKYLLLRHFSSYYTAYLYLMVAVCFFSLADPYKPPRSSKLFGRNYAITSWTQRDPQPRTWYEPAQTLIERILLHLNGIIV